MILRKTTMSKSRRTLTGTGMFLLICCLFLGLLPLRAHATTGSDYDFNNKYRWTVYWHVDNSYDASENVVSLYTYYGSDDNDVRVEGLSVQDVYTGDRDSHHHPAYDIYNMASSKGSHTTTMETNSPPMGFRYDIHGKGGNNCRWYLDKVEGVKVKTKKGRNVSVSWKKNKKADGYQVAWSTSKKFTKKTTKIRQFSKEKAANATIKKTIKNLKKGKTYYFRIRTCSLVTNKADMKTATVYGKWSGKKKVTRIY